MTTHRGFLVPAVLLMLTLGSSAHGQSGRGLMHGYVAFEDLSYNEVSAGAIRAKIELRGNTEFNHSVYTAETDRRGNYDIPAIGMGEYTLRITAPGHVAYQADLYIPSDFECRLAVMLKPVKIPSSGPSQEVDRALAHYRDLVLVMAHDSIAALFLSDGELSAAGQPTITGPAAIAAHLHSFAAYHVLANELVADSTRVAGDTAWQSGTYSQRVQVPAGDTVQVHGRFELQWRRVSGAGWRIRRIATRPPD